MSLAIRSLRSLRSARLAALLAATTSFAGAQIPADPVPLPPSAILNEILFDPAGVDGSVNAVGEWIEILVLRPDQPR
ncbi:MAG TPA: hypothetical protein VK348_06230 [Planctomycetota bacterium]|nr:hypothetical protein [Planctomycetota bacterium]